MFSATRKKNGLSCREWAAVLKEEFPAANAAGVSLAERSDESGITYTHDAQQYIKSRFGIKKKTEHRKDSAHLSVWFSEKLMEGLTMAKEKRGFNTIKAYIEHLVMDDIALIEKAARSGGTEQGGEEKCINSIITESEDLSNDY